MDELRTPLRVDALRRTVLTPGSLWRSLDVVTEIGSTNTELAARARSGAPEGAVLIAERQTAGRGRLGRVWESPQGAGIAMSVLLRPAAARSIPPARYGWLPLLAGVALVEAVGECCGLECGLKWPNDLLIDGRKCAGILAEIADGAVVIGIGLNVSLREDELPRADATSLLLEGALEGAPEGASAVGREVLIAAVLRHFESRYGQWRGVGGDVKASGLFSEYSEKCVTIGRNVRVELPGGSTLLGISTGIDTDGRLVVEHDDARSAIAAGDVLHIR